MHRDPRVLQISECQAPAHHWLRLSTAASALAMLVRLIDSYRPCVSTIENPPLVLWCILLLVLVNVQ